MALILEEGLPLSLLRRVVGSMVAACRACGLTIVTGDTKVVERGKADGLFLNTSGIGVVEAPQPIHPLPDRRRRSAAGQWRSGPARRGDPCRPPWAGSRSSPAERLRSPLAAVQQLLAAGCAAPLPAGSHPRWSGQRPAGTGAGGRAELQIEEERIPVIEPVAPLLRPAGLRAAALANEGRFLAVVPGEPGSERPLAVLEARGGGWIGCGAPAGGGPGRVLLRTPYGSERVLDRSAENCCPGSADPGSTGHCTGTWVGSALGGGPLRGTFTVSWPSRAVASRAAVSASSGRVKLREKWP